MIKKAVFLICWGILLLTGPLWGQSSQKQYRVYLRDGRILEGFLQDEGNKIFIKLVKGHIQGRVEILKRDILKIEEIKGKVLKKVYKKDLLILSDGREIECKVKRKDPLRVVVEVELEKNHKAQVSFRKSQIRTIIYAKDRAKYHYTTQSTEAPSLGKKSKVSPSLEAAIQKALGMLESSKIGDLIEARMDLLSLGIFAVPFIKSFLSKEKKKLQSLEDQKKLLQSEEPLLPLLPMTYRYRFHLIKQAIALSKEILGINEVKKLVTPYMEKKIRNIYSRLASMSPSIRWDVLKEIVLYTPKDAPPILGYFIQKEDEIPEIKAFCIAQLGILGENKTLISIYEKASGQTKFAAAIALGDNGIYLGIPTIIDALAIENLKIRRLAIKKLKSYTNGEFFGYFPEDPPERRTKAIMKWRQWWKEHGVELTKSSLEGTIFKNKIPLQEKQKGIRKWKEARVLLEKLPMVKTKEEQDILVDRIILKLEEALKHYPTFVAVRLNLATLLYQYKKEYNKAIQHLKFLLTLYRKEAGPLGQKMAHFHLGNIYLLTKNYKEAIFRYQKALEMD
ncbi:MAG: tetratricopeptide repeat protein, partial [Planctomycetota bacterium]